MIPRELRLLRIFFLIFSPRSDLLVSFLASADKFPHAAAASPFAVAVPFRYHIRRGDCTAAARTTGRVLRAARPAVAAVLGGRAWRR